MMNKTLLLFAAMVLVSFRLAAQTTLISFGSSWKYLDDGSNQGTAWRAPAFDDAAWKMGTGLFGYGRRMEATPISFGPNPQRKYTTTYFRKSITLANAAAITAVTANIKRDDGVVVYVNGQEVYRNNLPKGTITYTTLAASAQDEGQKSQTFTIAPSAFTSGPNVIAVEVHQTSLKSFDLAFDMELLGQAPIDPQSPRALSLLRHFPATQTTSAATVTFRLLFSEPVRGVDAGDFQLSFTDWTTGQLSSVAPADPSGTTYDITVSSLGGRGTVGLLLRGHNTGIVDASGNALQEGFTGQTYTIEPVPSLDGFVSTEPIEPLTTMADATKGKHQAKLFNHGGHDWAVLANKSGTHLWRLDETAWTYILTLTNKKVLADCLVDGDVAHILLYMGVQSELMSLEYVAASNTYRPWSKRPGRVNITLDNGVKSAAIARDKTGRLWLASDGLTDINVRYSDAPYRQWSEPITLAAGVNTDDICAITALPESGKIGVLWSNQQTDRFGFRTHTDGAAPTAWSDDEVPASQSAIKKGKGMADDHLNMKVGRDGTLYCAVKTGYDAAGYPTIALLVRRPAGTWDNLYEVSERGTAPIVILNEAVGKLRVIYTSQTYGGDILYRESALGKISFGKELILIRKVNNYATSSHQNFTSSVLILASNSTSTVGLIASDVPGKGRVAARAGLPAVPASEPGVAQAFTAYPNPFSTGTTLSFVLPTDGKYSLALYDGQLARLVFWQQGEARAGQRNLISLDGRQLPPGVYQARLQANGASSYLRLVLKR